MFTWEILYHVGDGRVRSVKFYELTEMRKAVKRLGDKVIRVLSYQGDRIIGKPFLPGLRPR